MDIAGVLASLVDCRVRVGLDTVLVESKRPDPSMLERTRSALAREGRAEEVAVESQLTQVLNIRARYGGEDLAAVSDAAGLTPSDLVELHYGTTWVVAMIGFAPGFGYLRPEDDNPLWSLIERRPSPRERVPAGSIAVAAGMSAVYPHDMPGGWQVIGHTDVRLFDAARSAGPSILRTGDRVRFTPAAAGEL
jgi:KipI family sensor histidine kinase inhibitor